MPSTRTAPALPTWARPHLATPEEVAAAARDAAYFGIGAFVLAAERAQLVTTQFGALASELVQNSVDRVRAAVSR